MLRYKFFLYIYTMSQYVEWNPPPNDNFDVIKVQRNLILVSNPFSDGLEYYHDSVDGNIYSFDPVKRLYNIVRPDVMVAVKQANNIPV